jgi:hypothetical protein
MIGEIEGALWPIYGAHLGGQYRIDLPLLLTIGSLWFQAEKEMEDITNLGMIERFIKKPDERSTSSTDAT